MNDFLKSAIFYASKGWRVLPARGKVPALKDWPKNASTHRPTLEMWFARPHPETNIGIATGPESGILVLDVDVKTGGFESLAELEAKYGALPHTVEAVTGSGGRHILFKFPNNFEIRNSAGKLGSGLDVRGIGGQIIVEPSIHPVSGHAYAWEVEHHPEDTALADVPKWLIEILTSKKSTASQPKSGEVREGSRKSTLMSRAGIMLRAGIGYEAIRAALIEENARFIPPLPDDEVESVFKSIQRYDAPGAAIEENGLESRIDDLDPATPDPVVESFIALASREEPLTRDRLINKICKLTRRSKRTIQKIAKRFENQSNFEEREAKKAALETAIEALGDEIIVPIEEDSIRPFRAHLVQKHASGVQYLVPFWNDSMGMTAPVLRRFEEIARESGVDQDEIPDGVGIPAYARREVERRIETGKAGKQVSIHFGPSLDKESGKLRTQSDIDAGVLICQGREDMGALLVYDSPTPHESPAAFERLKQLWGESWQDCLSHCIAAIVNECPSEKNYLTIIGSSESGKSRKAESIMQLISGSAVFVSPTKMEGHWPTVLSTRCATIDNLDYNSLKPDDLNILAALATTERVTVPARYTPSGLTKEGGYPIITSINSQVLDHYIALKSRSVTINQQYDEKARELALDMKAVVNEAKPHVWFLVEQFLKHRPEIPNQPGDLRIRGFARARYFVAKFIEMLTDTESEAVCRSYKQEQAIDEESPFIQAFEKAMKLHFASGVRAESEIFTASQIADMLQSDAHSIRVNSNTSLAEAKQPGKAIRKLIDQSRIGDKIGSWSVKSDRNKKARSIQYQIKRAYEQVSPAEAGVKIERLPNACEGDSGFDGKSRRAGVEPSTVSPVDNLNISIANKNLEAPEIAKVRLPTPAKPENALSKHDSTAGVHGFEHLPTPANACQFIEDGYETLIERLESFSAFVLMEYVNSKHGLSLTVQQVQDWMDDHVERFERD